MADLRKPAVVLDAALHVLDILRCMSKAPNGREPTSVGLSIDLMATSLPFTYGGIKNDRVTRAPIVETKPASWRRSQLLRGPAWPPQSSKS